MLIQYISIRTPHTDHHYGSGDWEFEQVKDVPDDIGRRMRAHVDVYILAPDDSKAGKTDMQKIERIEPDSKADDEDQNTLGDIDLMTKEQARDFIERHFKQKVDMRQFKTEDSIRAHAKMLYNQYGTK